MLADDRSQGSDQGHLLHLFRDRRQVLADVDSRNGRRDRFECAPHLGRRIRLEIEGVEMTGTAIEPDEDARLGSRLRRPQTLPLGKRDPKKGERSQLQSMAAGYTVTAGLWHEESLRWNMFYSIPA